MKKSEQKHKLVNELTELYHQLNVKRLYQKPDHRESKYWLSEVAAILKNLDETDFQAFANHRQHLYPSILEDVRKHAAEQIDGFVRQKVSEYKRYDFSSLDEDTSENKSGGSIGIFNRGKNNSFLNNTFIGLGTGIQDEGENSIASGNKFVGLEKKVKRGKENWNFIYLIYTLLLGVEFFILQILPLGWQIQMITFAVTFFITTWLCIFNPWFQNKLIGLKIKVEETWGNL